ncbi:hypothetical protein BST61_g10836 [Cercospora zeina]
MIWGAEVLGFSWPSSRPGSESRTTSLVVDAVKQLQNDVDDIAKNDSDESLVRGVLDSFSSIGLEFVNGSLKILQEKVEPRKPLNVTNPS